MIESLRHEKFYATNTWIDEKLGVYVGWVSRKNSLAQEKQRNDRGDRTLIISGEEFLGHRPMKCSKDGEGQYDSESPPYLMHLAETDSSFPSSLNGRFHGLLADRASGAVTLFIDRYGMQRLYYHQGKDAFYFAAEAKAILAVLPELRRIEPRAFGEYISCGCVLENRTLFDGISVLPGGAKWILRNSSVEQKGSYFQPREWEEQEILQPEVYYCELRDVFARSLPRYFESIERVGMSLTGGLDTRMILAWQKLVPGSVPCYTFGGMYRDCRDVIVARTIARICGQSHEVISIGKDFLERFPSYAERAVYLTDGCVDVRRAADLYLNERVRAIAPVRMTGNYGSEVLRGVRAFKPIDPLPGLFHQDVVPYLKQSITTYRSFLHGHPVSFAVFNQAPWHHYGLLALEQTQVALRTPYLDNDLVRTVFRAPLWALADYAICLRLIEDGNRALRAIPTDRGLGRTGVAGAVSRRMLEFLAKTEYAYDYGMPQWLAQLNYGFSPLHLERLFLGRHKFTHYRIWYRDGLASYVREMLLDPRTLSRPYLQRKRLEAMAHGHLKGNRNYTNEIHLVLTLELLHRLFIDAR
jgi:asparagine synthase (glutamine-hydrolysing)